MRQPTLYIFAGPNGAGKSTLSKHMVPPGTSIFDGDKEFALMRKNYPSIDDAQLKLYTEDVTYIEWKQQQLNKKTDCAIETNFRTKALMDSIKQFREIGYEINLIYFGLDSIQIAAERVAIRVMKGGHDVPLDEITLNYNQGTKHIEEFLFDFDNVFVGKNLTDDDNLEAKFHSYLKIINGKIIEQVEDLPHWVLPIINKIRDRYKEV